MHGIDEIAVDAYGHIVGIERFFEAGRIASHTHRKHVLIDAPRIEGCERVLVSFESAVKFFVCVFADAPIGIVHKYAPRRLRQRLFFAADRHRTEAQIRVGKHGKGFVCGGCAFALQRHDALFFFAQNITLHTEQFRQKDAVIAESVLFHPSPYLFIGDRLDFGIEKTRCREVFRVRHTSAPFFVLSGGVGFIRGQLQTRVIENGFEFFVGGFVRFERRKQRFIGFGKPAFVRGGFFGERFDFRERFFPIAVRCEQRR